MQKKILFLTMTTLLTMSAPIAAMNMHFEMGVAEQVEDAAPVINFEGNIVSVNGGVGQVLEIISLTGRPVASYKIDSPSQRFDLNLPKGCYILKVGKTVRKVTIK